MDRQVSIGRHLENAKARPSFAGRSPKDVAICRKMASSPLLLVINSAKMAEDDCKFGVSDNSVWCIETAPTKYIVNILRRDPPFGGII